MLVCGIYGLFSVGKLGELGSAESVLDLPNGILLSVVGDEPEAEPVEKRAGRREVCGWKWASVRVRQ